MCDHATNATRCAGWTCLSRHQSREREVETVSQAGGLACLLSGFEARGRAPSDASARVVRDGKSLALRRVAARRWRAVAILRIPWPHARNAVASRTCGRWIWACLSVAVQELHDRARRTPALGIALRRAQCAARRPGSTSRGLAVEQSARSSSRAGRDSRSAERLADGSASRLDRTGEPPADRRRGTSYRAIDSARPTAWRSRVGAAHGRAIPSNKHPPSARAAKRFEKEIKGPVPFN